MKAEWEGKPVERQERTKHRLLVAINELRLFVGWTSAEMNEHLDETFGVGVRLPDMGSPALFRLYKDLCELRKFHLWRAVESSRRVAVQFS